MRTRSDLVHSIDKCDLIAFWRVNQPWGCFSNWYSAKVDQFPTSEHAMMYAKAVLFGDMDTAAEIAQAKTPADAKAIGRKIRNFDEQIWDKYKVKIVVDILMRKFTQNETLKTILLSTGNRLLVEASPLDQVWGIGLAADDIRIYNPPMWNGENLLGFCLMEVRENLRKNLEKELTLER